MRILLISAIACLLLPAHSLYAQDDDGKLESQLQEIAKALNEESFEDLERYIDRESLSRRIYGLRRVERPAQNAFEQQFPEMLEYFVFVGLPSTSDSKGMELVHFEFSGSEGSALLRMQLPGYFYNYTGLELNRDSRDRVRIVDMQRYNARPALSEEMADYLATFMPTKETARALMKVQSVTDAELFQVSELLKAYRDNDNERFYNIYDGLDNRLQNDEVLSRYNLLIANYANDMPRLLDYIFQYIQSLSDSSEYSLAASDAYIHLGNLEEGYNYLGMFKQQYSLPEGSASARLSALALALGRPEDAESHALEAVQIEPGLELGWWSLLRARSGAGNNAGSLEALAQLEDRFGHELTEEKLRRDKYRGFAALADSQEFKDWRAGRE